jgi:uncharacterized protein (UPF0332 family)
MTTPPPASNGRSHSLRPHREPASIPSGLLPQRSPDALLALARRGLVEAAETSAPGLRYATAHLAALRAAAAVLAAKARPDPRKHRGRPATVWMLLSVVAPELTEWSAFFAAGAAKRAAAEAGIQRVVSTREADDLLRDAERFLAVVSTLLGSSHQMFLAG